MRTRTAIGVAVLASVTASGLVAQTHDHSAPNPPAQAGRGGMAGMMEGRQRMMADRKAADARLDALVKAAEDARGDAKVSALTAVVAELVKQHKAMLEGMEQGMMPMGRGRGSTTGLP